MAIVISPQRHLRCAFCKQTPEQVPWCHFSMSDPSQPMYEICYQCGDTCMKRWPCLSPTEAVEKAEDNAFVQQVQHLTKVKLGKDAKLFLPQSLVQDEEIGIRVEEQLVPLDRATFQSNFKTTLGPERFPELTSHPLRGADGSTQNWYLHRVPAAVPKITLWREHRLQMSELKLSHQECLDGEHGTELMDLLTKSFMNAKLPVTIPTSEEIKQLVQQRSMTAGSAAQVPTRGTPALTNGGDLPGVAAGSPAPGHTIPASSVGGSSALIALQVASGASLAHHGGGAKPNGRPKGSGRGVPATEIRESTVKRRRMEKAGSRASDVALPDVLACLRGESGVAGKSVLQVLHSWKTQTEGKFQRREFQQAEYLQATKEHRLRLCAVGLSPAAAGAASLSELRGCFQVMLQWDGMLPHHVFVTVGAKLIGQLWMQPRTLEDRIARAAAIASPEPPETQHRDMELLKDVPVAKLSLEDRWRVAHDLWLEEIVPKLMLAESDSLKSEALLTAAKAVRSWANRGHGPIEGDYCKALTETCGLLACHSQDDPIQTDQVRALRALFSPDNTTANHIKVLSQLFKKDWLSALKGTMGFCIHESQAAVDLERLFEGLRGDNSSNAWATLQDRWQLWCNTLRPRSLQRVIEEARRNIVRRLEVLSAGGVPGPAGAEEGLTLINLTTAFAPRVFPECEEEWARLCREAKEAHRNCTAESRWRAFMDTCRRVLDQTEGVAESVWAGVVAEVATQCDLCHGAKSPGDDQTTIVAAIRRIFGEAHFSGASLSLASRLCTFLPEAVEPELRKLAAASLTASRVVTLGDELSSGGVPGPAAAGTLQKRQALEEFRSAVAACPSVASEIAAWQSLDAKADLLATELSQQAAREAEIAKGAVERAAGVLVEQVAKCDWKAGLPQEGLAWAHIVREMDYKFWSCDHNPMKKMDLAYAELQSAKTTYEKVCDTLGLEMDQDVLTKYSEAKRAAEITNSEEYLTMHVKAGTSKNITKIRTRLDHILELFPYDAVHPLIRKAVTELTGL